MINTIIDAVADYRTLIIPACVWTVAQLLKVLIALVKDKRLDFTYLTSMGGMPSAHSALVCSLATTIGKLHGTTSPIFALATFLALIVMYDAQGVRQTVGIQSNILNRMLDELLKGQPAFEERLKELIGHSNLQVFVGAILGIGLAWWWA